MTTLNSKCNQNDPNMYAIIALNTGGSNTVERNILACHGLKPLKTLLGMYKGISESSYMVSMSDPLLVFDVAKWYNQESILILGSMVHGERDAQVSLTSNGDSIVRGTWKNHGANIPSGDVWTFDGNDYYTII